MNDLLSDYLALQHLRRQLALSKRRPQCSRSLALCAMSSLLCGFLLGRLASPECASPILHGAGFLAALITTVASLRCALRQCPARILELRTPPDTDGTASQSTD